MLSGAIIGAVFLWMRYLKKQRLVNYSKNAMQLVGNMLLQISGQ